MTSLGLGARFIEPEMIGKFEGGRDESLLSQQCRLTGQWERGHLYLERVENYLDSGKGECWLSNPQVAKLVSDALQYFDVERYVIYFGA